MISNCNVSSSHTNPAQARTFNCRRRRWITRKHCPCLYQNPCPVHVIADNVSAIKTVPDPKPRQGQLLAYNFYQHMLQWLQKNSDNTLKAAWCPGHSDIPGNEQADQLAKEATLLPSSSEPTTTHNIRHAREHLKRGWTTLWGNLSHNKAAGQLQTGYHHPFTLHLTS